MQALVSLIAVAGTLLGVVATYFFQRRTTERTLAEARHERARKEFLDGIVAVASESMTLRRAEYDRWKQRDRSPDGRESDDARQEVYRQRVVARNAMYRVRLLTDPARDGELVDRVRVMVERSGHVADATTWDELNQFDEAARESVERVVDLAAVRLREDP